jgi:predicted DNA-binding transcriptional regulator AlpA
MELTRLLKIKDVAELTQLQTSTIRKYVLNETIPFIKLDGVIRFDSELIGQWIYSKSKNSGALRKVVVRNERGADHADSETNHTGSDRKC